MNKLKRKNEKKKLIEQQIKFLNKTSIKKTF